MVVIKVPKTPKRAFNKDRPASDLLRAQVTHLEAVTAGPTAVARGMKTDRGRRKPMSEGQAADYIATFTRQMQRPTRKQAARAPEPPPVPAPATPIRKKKSVRRAKRKAVARKRTARTRKAKRAKAR